MHHILVLAKQFGVSESDLKGFAQSIINDMKKDGIVDAFLAMDEGEHSEVINAYALSAIKKMQTFTNKYFSDPKAAEHFRKTVRKLL